MSLDDIKRLARHLGRPKTNAAAEALIETWLVAINAFRSERKSFEAVLTVMLAGRDASDFAREFQSADNGVVSTDLRKFRRLVGEVRKAGK